MFALFLFLILTRPFISSLAFPHANFIHSLSLILVSCILSFKKIPSVVSEIKPFRYPVSFFVIAVTLSAIHASDKVTAAGELYKYFTGIMLFILGLICSPEERKKVIFCVIISALIISCLAIYQYFFGFQRLLGYVDGKRISDIFVHEYIKAKRVFLPFVTPNMLAGFLAISIPLCLPVKQKKIAAVLFLALVLTKSLGGLLAVFFAFIICYCPEKGIKKIRAIMLFLMLIIIAGIFAIRSSAGGHAPPLFSILTRMDYYELTSKLIIEHPFLGWGIANFNLVNSRYAHNSYLQITAEMGIFGLITFLWLVISVIKYTLYQMQRHEQQKILSSGLLTAAVCFLLHNLVDFTFFMPEVSFIWWVILGLMLPRNKTTSEKWGQAFKA